MGEFDYFDLESVKRHFETLTTHQEKILFCQEVIDCLQTDPDAVYDHGIWDYAGGNYDPRSLLTPKQRKADQVLEFAGLMKERSERAIEREAQTGQAVQNDGPDDPAPGKWDNLPAAIALCALLRAAGMPAGISDRAVGRFAKMLTGRSDKKMAAAHNNAVFGAFPDDHAKAVADALTEIGLDKVAAEVRRKFQKGGI
jgi:hypothetical protein